MEASRLFNVEKRKRILVAIVTVVTIFVTTVHAICGVALLSDKKHIKRRYSNNFYKKREYIRRLVHGANIACINNLRMNKVSFSKLCEMLVTVGGLKSIRHMIVDEQVGMFLNIIAHHVKNRVISHNFERSGETVSRVFHKVLNAVIKLRDHLFQKTDPIPNDSVDARWKWFKKCLGALDGTHIKIRVPAVDKLRYTTRKGEIATNVLAACTPTMQFVYVLPRWEGSAADGRVLHDTLSRTHGLKVPQGELLNTQMVILLRVGAITHGFSSVGCYYLVDAGYTNCNGFLAPFRGQRYHLNEWRQGYQPTTPEEFFNMKHAMARNVIERCFGLLKLRWSILRSPSFYSAKIHNRIIMACCMLHNFIRQEMAYDPIEEEYEEGIEDSHDSDEMDASIISIEPTNQWSEWRANLALEMFNEWRGHRNR